MMQHELGQLVGSSQTMIAQYESGKTRPRYERAERIAAALGHTVQDFWPTLERAVRKGRLLDTVIPAKRAIRTAAQPTNLRLVHDSEIQAMRVRHTHRPPLCCGAHWCRCVTLDEPETYPVFGDPTQIEFVASGGA